MPLRQSRKRSSRSDSGASQKKKKRIQDAKKIKTEKRTEKLLQGRKQKKTPPQTQKPQRQKAQRSLDNFQEKIVSTKKLANWKVVQKPTHDLVIGLVDQAIMSSLNHTSAVSYSNVQDHLNNLKDRVTNQLKGLKVPTTRYMDYRKMESQCKLLEEVLVQSSSQVELMESQAEQLEESVKEKEDEVKQIVEKTNLYETNQTKWKKKLHPILREDYAEQFNIAPLPEESYQVPAPEVNDDLDPQQTRLLQRLSYLQSSNAASDLTEYVENVGAVANALTNKD
ncbi:uncharacterized protein LOC144449196 [Glandiceps talaboti]